MATDKLHKVAWYRSIQTKVTVTLLVVTTLILGGFAAYNLERARTRLNDDLQQLAQTTVQRLSRHVIGPMWALNKEQLVHSIEASMLERRVDAIVIRDEDGKSIYVSRKRDAQGKLVPVKGTPQGNLIAAKVPLFHVSKVKGRETIGTLQVYITRQFLRRRFDDLMTSELRRVAVIDIAIIAVTLLLLQHLLVGPIRRLTSMTDSISMGELDTRVDIRSHDEVGLLADAIGKLQLSLKIAMDRMKRGQKR